MKLWWVHRWLPVVVLCFVGAIPNHAQNPRLPVITDITQENSQKIIRFTPYPAAEEYRIVKLDRLGGKTFTQPTGILSGYSWKSTDLHTDPLGFFRLQVNTLSDEDLLTAIVLNRLAYGPTPDELERVRAIGPDAYIQEQLAPEKIPDHFDLNTSTNWQYLEATGTNSYALLYLALSSAGEGYVDDIKLVTGRFAGVGGNLIRNGDFELSLSTNDWIISPNYAPSRITTDVSHSGSSSLHLIGTSGGTSRSSAIWQRYDGAGISATQRLTLSCWFLPSTQAPANLTVRLAGTGLAANSSPLQSAKKLAAGTASLRDLQSWLLARAVKSKRQLLEVLTQFVDNHFTTYQPKSQEYLTDKTIAGTEEALATEFEYRELNQWRDVLVDPNGTFFDLLKISAESPAMVIYLDTVTSENGAANENYARELMELFTMGVDNGYDQRDIEEMSRAWTGWRVDKLRAGQEDDPFAAPLIRVVHGTYALGAWSTSFRSDRHDPGAKTIFEGKTVAARFGPPYAGKSYELKLPERVGNEGMRDGYEILAHLANQPHTQEYLSVKLCRLFVHEHFAHGVYDYTAPNLSAEAALVRECMRAWETPASDGRKGNLRQVLSVIFRSPLFRHHAASRQKVRTPLEFAVSAVRALRAARPDGRFTSDSDGADLIEWLGRMGMLPFKRIEPDGWPEFGADWINSSSLLDRVRFVQSRLRFGSRTCDPVSLVRLKLPARQWGEAEAVTDYFLRILFPGEGKANLDLDRTLALSFLNTLDDGKTPSPLKLMDPASFVYDQRVRGMVIYLMGLPRFQEQ